MPRHGDQMGPAAESPCILSLERSTACRLAASAGDRRHPSAPSIHCVSKQRAARIGRPSERCALPRAPGSSAPLLQQANLLHNAQLVPCSAPSRPAATLNTAAATAAAAACRRRTPPKPL